MSLCRRELIRDHRHHSPGAVGKRAHIKIVEPSGVVRLIGNPPAVSRESRAEFGELRLDERLRDASVAAPAAVRRLNQSRLLPAKHLRGKRRAHDADHSQRRDVGQVRRPGLAFPDALRAATPRRSAAARAPRLAAPGGSAAIGTKSPDRPSIGYRMTAPIGCAKRAVGHDAGDHEADRQDAGRADRAARW